ncbi:MAG: DUF885 domain-containing protein [Fidelibacterota bacterium]
MKKVTSKYFITFVMTTGILVYLMLISAPNQRYENIEKDFLDYYFKANPINSTWIGIHTYDGLLPDYDTHQISHRIHELESFNQRCQTIDEAALDSRLRIDYAILCRAIDELLFQLEELREYSWNPLQYTYLLGFAYESLTAYDFAPAAVRRRNLESRLAATPGFLAQAMTHLKSMPEPHVQTARRQVQGLIHSLERGFPNLCAQAGEFDEQDWQDSLDRSVNALNDFLKFLDAYAQEGQFKSFRLGPELYTKKLHYTINENLNSDEILSRAEAELRQIQGDMITIAEPLYHDWFGEKPDMSSHQAQLNMVRRVLDRIAQDHPEPDAILPTVRSTIDELTAFIQEKGILTLDASKPLEIRKTPEYQRGISIASLQTPGPLEKNLNTYYNVSPLPEDWDETQIQSFLREYNTIALKILSIHEALPGHYVQLYYAGRHPSLVRSIFSSGVMIEGWAHYAEGMMIEAGFGEGDPRYALIEKKWKLRGIANAIIDQKTHAGTLTEEEALDLMIQETFQEEAEAKGKWRRAQLTATQLSTYFAGNMLMWDLRRDYEEIMGPEFSLRAFHENLLAQGSLPVRFLRQIMLEEQ